jgi:hypothetical protein
MKTPVILNLVWAGVAGAAFYTGMKYNSSDNAKNPGQKNLSVMSSPAAGTGGGKLVNPLMVSKDNSVIDFFKQYGLDTGVPLTPDKMKEAMLTAIREGDPVKSQMMFARLMEELNAENAPAALAMIRENVGGFDSMRYMGMLAYKWGEVDPTAAMKELAKGDDRGGRFTQGFVLTGWAAKDPQAAIAWLAAYEGDPREKGMMTNLLVNGLARSSPEDAMKYAANIKDDGERARAAESIAREIIRAGGAEKATAWLNGITDPEMKRGAFQTVSDQLLRSDPAKAAEFIKQYASEDYARGAVANLANSLAKKDLQQGLTFAEGLTGEAQAKAYGSVISEWLDKDKGAGAADAAKYVESMAAGPNKDAGARELAQQAMRQDPATAIAWASSIQDPATREESLIDVGRRYLRQDPAAGAAWLASSGLSAEAQQKVTAPRDFGGPGGGFGGGGFPGGGRGNYGGGGGVRTQGTGGGAAVGTDGGGRGGRGAGGGGRGRGR